MNVLIAFGKRLPDPKLFLDKVVELAKDDGMPIGGAILTPGPGCWNLALAIDHADAENFTNQLTMALMPAKWEVCHDPRLKVGEFLVEAE
mgnify:CR=1 FL=1